MIQTISAENPIDRSTAEYEILNSQQFHAGGYETKRLLTVSLVGQPKSQSFTLVEKEIPKLEDLQKYSSDWLAFRNAGLPVVSYMAVTNRKSVVMTDLKSAGEELYGRGLNMCLGKESKQFRRSSTIDMIFRRLMNEYFTRRAIRNRVFSLASRATDSGIVLPTDDAFELLVRPDGSWDLITVDLSWANPITLRSNNRESADSFLHDLVEINQNLK